LDDVVRDAVMLGVDEHSAGRQRTIGIGLAARRAARAFRAVEIRIAVSSA
jgi:hypothetical protein